MRRGAVGGDDVDGASARSGSCRREGDFDGAVAAGGNAVPAGVGLSVVAGSGDASDGSGGSAAAPGRNNLPGAGGADGRILADPQTRGQGEPCRRATRGPPPPRPT